MPVIKAKDCLCRDWARVESNILSEHHPNCDFFRDEIEERFAGFNKAQVMVAAMVAQAYENDRDRVDIPLASAERLLRILTGEEVVTWNTANGSPCGSCFSLPGSFSAKSKKPE